MYSLVAQIKTEWLRPWLFKPFYRIPSQDISDITIDLLDLSINV